LFICRWFKKVYTVKYNDSFYVMCETSCEQNKQSIMVNLGTQSDDELVQV